MLSISFLEVRIRLQSYNNKKLDMFEKIYKKIIQKKGLTFYSIKLPVLRQRITVLRSPHVNKKSKDQYELALSQRCLILKDSSEKKIIIEDLKELEAFQKFFGDEIRVKISSTFSYH